MTDAFAEFGFEKRPWLDPQVLQSRYHELASIRHPDRCGGVPHPLSRLNEARGILASPSSRLRHLLNFLPPPANPECHFQPDFDLFSSVGDLSRRAEILATKRDQATSPLTAVLAKSEIDTLEKELLPAVERLNGLARALEEKILGLDARWPDVRADELAVLAEEDGFYQNWQRTLREARTRLLGG